jgi:hypothetical protein
MKFLYISIFALMVVSCSESKMLQKSLGNFNAPIAYLHDSKIIDSPKTDSLIIWLNNKSLDSITNVTKINAKLLPFLVFNYSEVNLNVKLGQSSLQQKYDDFFANSLLDESDRTGCFGISNLESNASFYTLDITIDTCSTNSKYQRSTTVLFLFFAYSVSSREAGFPAETNLKVSTQLKKGGVLIAEKSYAIKRTQPFIPTPNTSLHNLRADFTTNMVESLSLSTKQCVEDIINDVNRTIQEKRSSTTSSVK